MKKEVLFLFFAFVLIGYASAVININITAEESYNIGENASFSYSISSDSDVIIRSIAIINCVGSSYFFPEIKMDYELVKDVPFSSVYNRYVNDSLTSQICNATVYLITPEKITIVKEIRLIGNVPVNPSGNDNPGDSTNSNDNLNFNTNNNNQPENPADSGTDANASEENLGDSSNAGNLDSQISELQGNYQVYWIVLACVSGAIVILGAIVVILFLKIIKKD